MKVTISFSLDDRQDSDILTWLKRQADKQRSAAIREALRKHVQSGNVTLADVYHAVKDVERKIGRGLVAAPGPDQEEARPEEDTEAAAALDALAKTGM